MTHIKDENRRFPCNFNGCNKGFNLKATYHNHMNAHKGIKPHKCNICGKCFSYPGNLYNHKARCRH